MTSYHGWTHAPKAQGGSDPIPGLPGGTSSCYLADLVANGTGASIPDNTWSDVVTGVDGANDRWFDEFNKDPNGGWGRDFNSGTITNSANALYSAWGYVVFDSLADGEWIGAAINWVGQEVQINTGQTANGRDRIMVYAERVPIPVGGVKLQCWQNSGGAVDLIEARLHVRKYEDYSTFEQQFAT